MDERTPQFSNSYMNFQRKIYLTVAMFFIATLFMAGCAAAPTPQPKPTLDKANIDFSNTLISLTFDDGDADNYLIRSALKDNGLRATFYVVSGLTGSDGYMTVDQLHDLYQDGNEIGGHTLTHSSLSDVRGDALKKEVCQDRLNLLNMGFDVTSFAYPFGYYDDEAIKTVKLCGYNNARIVTDGPQEMPVADPYKLEAMPYIVQDTSFNKMASYVKEISADGGGWMIFVFHHVCNGCDEYAVDYDTFVQFAEWIGYRQQNAGLKVETIAEIIGGEVQPGVSP